MTDQHEPSTRVYTDVVTEHMDAETAAFHMRAYVNVGLLRRGRTLRFRAINDHLGDVAQSAVDEERLPTEAELDDLAEAIAALEPLDPTRR